MANHATIKDTQFNVGDTVRVFYRIIEKETTAGKTKKEVKETVRERFQPFEGVVIGIRGRAENQSFIVRRIGAGNIGIERIFPSVSPWISKIVVTRKGQVRRAKLNYLRGAKKDKLKSEAVKEEIVSKKVLKAESQKPSEEKSADANKEVQQDLKAEKPKEVKVDTKVEKKEVKEAPKAAK